MKTPISDGQQLQIAPEKKEPNVPHQQKVSFLSLTSTDRIAL
jgi:hypothetical protein